MHEGGAGLGYHEELDARVADVVEPWGSTRKKMFGGTGFMLHGNMLAGVHGDRLILRLSEQDAADALAQPHVRPFDMVPRPMRGWVMVDREGLDAESLERWLYEARSFVETLPPK